MTVVTSCVNALLFYYKCIVYSVCTNSVLRRREKRCWLTTSCNSIFTFWYGDNIHPVPYCITHWSSPLNISPGSFPWYLGGRVGSGLAVGGSFKHQDRSSFLPWNQRSDNNKLTDESVIPKNFLFLSHWHIKSTAKKQQNKMMTAFSRPTT